MCGARCLIGRGETSKGARCPRGRDVNWGDMSGSRWRRFHRLEGIVHF